MIPRLALQESLKPDFVSFLEALAKTAFCGEIRANLASRLTAATDNSIYQILPQAVIFPKNTEDLVYLFGLAQQEPFKQISFSPRGAGTGTNGQSLSQGIAIDCSRYMNQILEINLEQGWVRVQPGVVLDQLNADLKPYGVFFAPSLSPSNRATLGGMINTDACGKGSRIYGRTSNHIVELTWVLADGTVGRSQAVDRTSLSALKAQPDRLGEIYRQVENIIISKQEAIEQIFPKIPRFMTGYNLAKVYDRAEETFNLNWLIAGSEGTLGVVTEAKLKLTRIPKYKSLLAIHYACFDDALLATETLLAAQPAAIETIDETILDLAKQDIIYDKVSKFIHGAKALNLVEFIGNDLAQIQVKINTLCQNIEIEREQKDRATGYYLAQNAEEIANLWELRKKGVGLLGNTKGDRKPIAFIEDTAVPPSLLAPYIRELKGLLSEYQLDYAMFGHVDVGCLHVRPALDMKAPPDEKLIRELSDKVVALVRKYGGVMWGEHGKGFRSEYTPLFFGELYEDLRKIKAVFDPDNRLNPGKIVAPWGRSEEVVRLEAPLRGHFDRQVPVNVRSQYQEAFDCNGNGACFNYDPDDVMCPSSKVTRDRIHSPKGRATLLREWLRQLPSDRELAKPASFPQKVWNTLRLSSGVYDYSHEVYEGMHGCLSCKACAQQCPVHVDVPQFKAKFLQLYHTRYLRSARDYLMGHIETIAHWQSNAPRMMNAIAQTPISRWLIQQSLNLVDPPALSAFTLKQGLTARLAPKFSFAHLSRLSEVERSNSAILLQDAFTSFYESQLVLDTYDFLKLLGYTVYVAPFKPSGKPLHVKGFLKQFQTVAQNNAQYLRQLGSFGIPLIGIEPSIVLTYRDEYRLFVNADASLPPIKLLQEFLVQQCDRLPQMADSKPYYLFAHCTEKTAATASLDQWQQVFQAMGLSLIPLSTGCCGMAGIYGHEAEHYTESKGIYQMSWARHIPPSAEERQHYLATGYSCRSQVLRFDGFMPAHPIQVLLQQARENGY